VRSAGLDDDVRGINTYERVPSLARNSYAIRWNKQRAFVAYDKDHPATHNCERLGLLRVLVVAALPCLVEDENLAAV